MAGLFWLSLLFGSIFLLYLDRLANRIKIQNRRPNLASAFYLNKGTNLFLATGIVLASFRFFTMFATIFFNQAVQTSKVLVDSHLVQSLKQLLHSDLVVCFAEENAVYLVDAPQETVLSRLFTRKSTGSNGNSFGNSDKFPNNCVVNFEKLRNPLDMTKKAMFVQEMVAKMFLVTWTRWKTGSSEVDFWQSPPLFDMICVHFHRTGLDRNV